MENEKAVLDYGSRTLTTGKANAGLPDALAKACEDAFEYALGLRDGTILFFDECTYEPGSEWIHLHRVTGAEVSPTGFVGEQIKEAGTRLSGKLFPIPLRRGIDIRLADVMWAADGPWGS